MHYNYNSEQDLFRDSLRKLFKQQYSYEFFREQIKSKQESAPAIWQQLLDFGLFALPFGSDFDGLGDDPGYALAAMEELGYGRVLEPVLATILMPGALLNAADNSSITNGLIPQFMAGGSTIAVAWQEAAAGFKPEEMATSATAEGDEITINGEKVCVLSAPAAQQLIVIAVDQLQQANAYLLDADAPGVTLTAYQTVDGASAANITLQNVVINKSAQLFNSAPLHKLQSVLAYIHLALGAEVVGMAERLMEITAEFCKTRFQFGQPIAAFQAVQHRLADMQIATQKLQSLFWFALDAYAAGDYIPVNMLKAEIGASGVAIGQSAVQLHGGIAMTDELSVGAYLKRILAIELTMGQREEHLESIAGSLSGELEQAPA
ncbi:acyl-CoA dehydrogenase family protein [Halioxenophilus sp. WMMB6]|uniref:acyl-CoA dehydrogenase family protein n=1 Tax=Halioxenophilus sp. WMMB6 TaxID=3073815 RepID=UPI00295EE0DE|nr:acyl-CoA dehydrogenase family protein [Halioxenophilus sp. WMMB6]